jgi:hypothetical protein
MSTNDTFPDAPLDEPDPALDLDREEILIGRVVDSEAADADWRELNEISSRDPLLWRRLADAQRAHDRLREAFAHDVAPAAERVEAPAHVARHASVMTLRLRAWSGWAAAACLGAALLSSTGVLPTHRAAQHGLTAGPTAPLTPDQALDTYLKTGEQAGRVVAQLPKTVIECRENPAGGYDVVYTRVIVERAVVPTAVEVRYDEAGQPVLFPASSSTTLTGRPL